MGLCDDKVFKCRSGEEFKSLKVLEVYPNPSFGNALIKYELPENAIVSLRLYDISGRLVNTIYSGTQEKGEYEVELNGEYMGSPLPTGIYFLRLEVPINRDFALLNRRVKSNKETYNIEIE
ncbi:MAG: T9SS type A sorting domain-containing protein [bacterium]|nr:T9SS type A sorting domain-containing protein [bacterium]